MDIPNLRDRTVEKLRNATLLGTFDSYPEAEETAQANRPACITQGDEGWTVWRLDGHHHTGLEWDRLLPAVHALVDGDVPLWMQAAVDQQQAAMRANLGRYGLGVDERTVFTTMAANLAIAAQVAQALELGLLPLRSVQIALGIVRGNLTALLPYIPAGARS